MVWRCLWAPWRSSGRRPRPGGGRGRPRLRATSAPAGPACRLVPHQTCSPVHLPGGSCLRASRAGGWCPRCRRPCRAPQPPARKGGSTGPRTRPGSQLSRARAAPQSSPHIQRCPFRVCGVAVGGGHDYSPLTRSVGSTPRARASLVSVGGWKFSFFSRLSRSQIVLVLTPDSLDRARCVLPFSVLILFSFLPSKYTVASIRASSSYSCLTKSV